MSVRIAFAGSPEFACPTLRALVEAHYAPVAVYTQLDRPAGRGRKLTACPVKKLAQSLSLPIHQVQSLRDPGAQQTLADLNLDLMIVAAYGLILPKATLAIPKLGCVNLHASLLPRWRGASPIQQAILAGDLETGVTLMQMDAGLDTGDLLANISTPITVDDTTETLSERLAQLGAKLLIAQLPALLDGALSPTSQAPDLVTHAGKIQKSDANIDWTLSAVKIERMIRAYQPWPVAYTEFGGERLRIWAADTLCKPDQSPPATILSTDPSTGLIIQTGQGQLRVTELQRPGKTRMQSTAFLKQLAYTKPVTSRA